MKLCSAQLSPCWNDPKAGFQKVKNSCLMAAKNNADLIVFPEQFITGWDPEDSESFVEDESGDIVTRFREIAEECNIAILGSFRENDSDGPKNTAIAIDKSGDFLTKYSKIHLFSPAGEDKTYIPGNNPGVFTIAGCKCGIAICYDLRFSSLFRYYRDLDVELMVVPCAWPMARINYFKLFSKTRAVEFQMYIASVNTVGKTPVDTYSGGSLVVTPDGRIIIIGNSEEILLYSEIDPESVRIVRKAFPIKNDERLDLFR